MILVFLILFHFDRFATARATITYVLLSFPFITSTAKLKPRCGTQDLCSTKHFILILISSSFLFILTSTFISYSYFLIHLMTVCNVLKF